MNYLVNKYVFVAPRKKNAAVQIITKNFTTTPLPIMYYFLSSDHKWDCVCVHHFNNTFVCPAINASGKSEGKYGNNVSGTTLRDKDIRHSFPQFWPTPTTTPPETIHNFPNIQINNLKKTKQPWNFLFSYLERNFYRVNEATCSSRQTTLQVAAENKCSW